MKGLIKICLLLGLCLTGCEKTYFQAEFSKKNSKNNDFKESIHYRNFIGNQHDSNDFEKYIHLRDFLDSQNYMIILEEKDIENPYVLDGNDNYKYDDHLKGVYKDGDTLIILE